MKEKDWLETVECDTPVPFYDMGVSCGLPSETGNVPAEMMMVPGMLTMGIDVGIAKARGNSMQGVGIQEGDLLMLEKTQRFQNDDIVLVSIDGEELLKTYHIDEEGRHWLVPANDEYEATLLREDMDIKYGGRLLWHMRKEPHDTLRNICRAITRTKEKKGIETERVHVLTRDEVERALVNIGPKIMIGRHWFGPCRVLMDRGFIPQDRYDLFCELVCNLLPGHLRLPREAELRRMAIDCFSKPFATWKDEKAPVHGKHYRGYYNAAVAMEDALP